MSTWEIEIFEPLCYDNEYDDSGVYFVPDEKLIQEDQVLLEGNFAKNSPQMFPKSLRIITITNKFVMILKRNKDNKEVNKYIKLLFVYYRIWTFSEQKIMKYRVSLHRGNHSIELFTTNQTLFNDLISILSEICPKKSFKDDYDLLKEIGSGAYSKVYHSSRKSDGEQFAIKVLSKPQISCNSKLQISLQSEILLLKGLTHSNIPRLYEIHEIGNEFAVVMEFIPGINLFEHIKFGKSTEEEIVETFRCLVDILHYLDKYNIIHRDIKPENIILRNNKSSDPVLIDFGFAVYSDNYDITLRCGTPGYVAPEVLKKGIYSNKSDIFSLGVVLFMMLSKTFPFPGKDFKSILKSNLELKISYKEQSWSRVSIDSKKLTQKLLEKKADKRPSYEMLLNVPANCKGSLFFMKAVQHIKDKDNFIKMETIPIDDKSIYKMQSLEAPLVKDIAHCKMFSLKEGNLKMPIGGEDPKSILIRNVMRKHSSVVEDEESKVDDADCNLPDFEGSNALMSITKFNLNTFYMKSITRLNSTSTQTKLNEKPTNEKPINDDNDMNFMFSIPSDDESLSTKMTNLHSGHTQKNKIKRGYLKKNKSKPAKKESMQESPKQVKCGCWG